MAKKKMPLQYVPAVLKQAKSGWYIRYQQWHPILNKRVPFRERHELNRIKDLKLRLVQGQQIVNRINDKLPSGWPFEHLLSNLKEISLGDALRVALSVKLSSPSRETRNSYRSMISMLIAYLEDNGLDLLPVTAFTRSHCLEYLDWVVRTKGVQGCTYNNYIIQLKSTFTELLDREYIDVNPFSKMAKKKTAGKRRLAFSKSDRKVVAEYIKANNSKLYLGLILQYYCFIRPNELRYMKPHMFDFDQGLIRITANVTKNSDNDIITIPDCINATFRQLIDGIKKDEYIFGACYKRHQDKPISKNYMNRQHRCILQDLKAKGKIEVIKDLSFYSWKDTGGIVLAENGVSAVEIMLQMRHKNLSYTQRYLNSLHVVNKQIKNLQNFI